MTDGAVSRKHGALLVDDTRFDAHAALGHHPERPERLVAARAGVRGAAGVTFQPVAAQSARDEDLARGVLLSDDEVDRLRDAVYKELVAFMQEQSTTIPRAVDLMFIAHNLERIADHATNIAEDVLFLVKGIDVRHHSEVREPSLFSK